MSFTAVVTIKNVGSPAEHINTQILADFKKRLATDLGGAVAGSQTTLTVEYVEPQPVDADGNLIPTPAEAEKAHVAWSEGWYAGYDEAQARQAEIDAEAAEPEVKPRRKTPGTKAEHAAEHNPVTAEDVLASE